MAQLPHSRRSLLQAVHAQSLRPGEQATSTARPWVKRAFFAATRPTDAEVAAVRSTLEAKGGFAAAALDDLADAIALATGLAPPTNDAAARFGKLDNALLFAFAEMLIAHRRVATEKALAAYRSVSERVSAHKPASARGQGASPSLLAWLGAGKATKQETEEITAPLLPLSGAAAMRLSPASFEEVVIKAGRRRRRQDWH